MAYDDYRKQMEKLVADAADAVERLVNGGESRDRKAFVDRLGSMHRTLQQKFIGDVVIPLVREMASRMDSGNYDARNEMACDVCKDMLEGLKAKEPYIASGECSLPLI